MKKFKQADRRKKKYNISAFETKMMLERQGNMCPICNKILNMDTLCVDHDHHIVDPNDNSVRGLLCSHCNLGLGHFFDDIVLLQNAIDYLKKTKKTWI